MDSILLIEVLYEICRPFLYLYLLLGGISLVVVAVGIAVLIICELWQNDK